MTKNSREVSHQLRDSRETAVNITYVYTARRGDRNDSQTGKHGGGASDENRNHQFLNNVLRRTINARS